MFQYYTSNHITSIYLSLDLLLSVLLRPLCLWSHSTLQISRQKHQKEVSKPSFEMKQAQENHAGDPPLCWVMFKIFMTLNYTDWFVGILIAAYHSSYTTWEYSPLHTPSNQGFGFCSFGFGQVHLIFQFFMLNDTHSPARNVKANTIL